MDRLERNTIQQESNKPSNRNQHKGNQSRPSWFDSCLDGFFAISREPARPDIHETRRVEMPPFVPCPEEQTAELKRSVCWGVSSDVLRATQSVVVLRR